MTNRNISETNEDLSETSIVEEVAKLKEAMAELKNIKKPALIETLKEIFNNPRRETK